MGIQCTWGWKNLANVSLETAQDTDTITTRRLSNTNDLERPVRPLSRFVNFLSLEGMKQDSIHLAMRSPDYHRQKIKRRQLLTISVLRAIDRVATF